MQPCRTQCAMMAWDPDPSGCPYQGPQDGHTRSRHRPHHLHRHTHTPAWPGRGHHLYLIRWCRRFSSCPRGLAIALLQLRVLLSPHERPVSSLLTPDHCSSLLLQNCDCSLRPVSTSSAPHLAACSNAQTLTNTQTFLVLGLHSQDFLLLRPASVAHLSSCLYDHTFFQKEISPLTQPTDIICDRTWAGPERLYNLRLFDYTTTNTPTAAQSSATVIVFVHFALQPPPILSKEASSPTPRDLR